MTARQYVDFDLSVEQGAAALRARVLNSPAGQASHDFSLPFTQQELRDLADRLVYHPGPDSAEAARAFGARLHDAVFGGDVQIAFLNSLNEAERSGTGLRIRLRLADVPTLVDVPWELLYSPRLDRFLALSDETPIVRFIELLDRIRPLEVKPPLRILALIAGPSDYPQLDVEREWQNLGQACSQLQAAGLVELERVEPPTFAACQQRLRQGEFHILHFVGHGSFDSQSQEGLLILEDPNGEGKPTSSREMGMLLHDHAPLRLVVLNACKGAVTSPANPFGGTAQALIRQGVPAVLAMQGPITDQSAITFSSEFYCAVADGYPVDAALAQGRKAIRSQGAAIEWAWPVLQMRAPDGQVFSLQRLTAEEQARVQAACLARAVEAALQREDWPAAVEKAQALASLQPSDSSAALVARARRQQQLAALYGEGRKHYEAGRRREAFECFRRVQGIQASYRDVEALMAVLQAELAKEQAAAPAVRAADRAAVDALEPHFKSLVKAFVDGRVVPFIGAGANVFGRPAGAGWTRGKYLPDRRELAEYLAQNFGYAPGQALDLVRVSEYVSIVNGSGPLYEELHTLLDDDYPPTPLHIFLATLPRLLREKGYPPRYPLIVTTNYDDLLERALRAAEEPFDLVTYVTEGEFRGKFMHYPSGGEGRLIESENDYPHIPLDRRTVVLKIHGAIDRQNRDRDSFVITEDDYIEYLARMDSANPVPKMLAAKMRFSHFLFLGYALRDWNLRVVLRRIWDERKRSYKSWAVQPGPEDIDREFWRKHDVDILDVRLEDYIGALKERVEGLPRP